MNGTVRARTLPALRRRMAIGVATALIGTLLQGISSPAVAEVVPDGLPGLPAPAKPIAGHPAKVEPRPLDPAPKTPRTTPRANWGEATSALVEVPAKSGTWRTAGTSPVALATPRASAGQRSGTGSTGKTHVRILSRTEAAKTGIEGLVFTVTPPKQAEGATADEGSPGAGVRIEYADFAQAYGGAYASRLRLVQLPACSLNTPQKAACREARPLPGINDTEKQTLTADKVALTAGAATVLAAQAGPSSEAGDYTATPLSPSAAWKTDLNTGSFTWSYDMPVPHVPGGLQPDIALSYSSGGIDGRTGTTNNQSTWVGDGFDLWPGYIERRYKPCSDDDVENADGNTPGDLCWGYDNAFISFNGKAGELVPVGEDRWKLQNDDGTRIARLTGSQRDNGDNNNEYWELTTPEGVRYYFGYHKLPGWAAGKETTDSTWTTPVFGDDNAEPCHESSFATSWCQQAWRWNVDYVVDPRGNAISYYYDKETNSYGRNLEAADDTSYTRGGSLDRIEYGLKSADLYTDKPLAKVDFDGTERCIPQTGVTCAADTIGDKSFYWYDTPWDMNCPAATECDRGRLAPTFWTRKRLTSVTTSVLGSSGTHTPVDSWKLAHRWGMADVDYQLLLDSVQHTGHTATPAVTLPKTTFVYSQAANRLDRIGDSKAPFIKERLATVADEYGGQIDVDYSAAACTWDDLPTPQTNTTRCFPQYIGGSSSDDPTLQWFNKYVIDSVTLSDRTGGSPDQVTRYSYLDGAAWHFDDDDGLTKEKFKTWSQWRGYGHVRVQSGGQGAGGMKSQADHYFLRGMHGDKKAPTGGTKTVEVTLDPDEGDPITDHESAAGFEYKAQTFSGPGGRVLSKSVNRPWHHETGKRTRDWGTVTSNFTGTGSTREFASLDDGAGAQWQQKTTATTYDTVAGRPVQVDDRGDTTRTRDDRCTRTEYATNAAANILSLPSRVETVATACSTSPVDRSKDVISDIRTAYDKGEYGAAPSKGDATSTATLKEHTGTRATYLESGATHDAYGRPLSATDLTATVVFDSSGNKLSRTARGDSRTTTTVYTPATGFATQTAVTTPPAKTGVATTAQTTTTSLDPARGAPVTKVDQNNLRTDFTYDALGRSLKVWLPNRLKSANHTPNREYTYTVTEGRPVAIGAKTLGKSALQLTSYSLYDGFLRPRQTQGPGPDGGRLLTDTFYDERGLTAKSFAPYYATGAPETELFALDNALSVETQVWNTYDGLGRITESRQVAGNGDGGKPLGTTRTTYGGDRVTVIPPVGGTATTTVTDARGLTTELRQHHARATDAAYDTTRYTYTGADQLDEVTDPAGNRWSYTYDQLGRTTTSTDPDHGTVTNAYDDRGQLISTTNSRKSRNKLFHTYDDLGRKTELREGSAAGTKLAEWSYDTVSGAKGYLASSTRYAGGNTYVSKVDDYDPLYRATRTSVAIPAAEEDLQGTYRFSTSYNVDGTVQGAGFPAAGALPGGGLVYTYDDILRPTEITGSDGLKSVTGYSLTGKPLQTKLHDAVDGSAGKVTQVTNTYEWGTQRQATSRVDREGQPGVDKHATYTYDESGNIRAIADVSRTGTDAQCFTYDHLRRVTQEWAQSTQTCAESPGTGSVGGPAPYWNSYTYDTVGNRRTETNHDLGGDKQKDSVRTYAYPAAGAPRPHAATVVETSGPSGTSRDTYTYDETGNTETRTLGGDEQTLEWDAEGHLAKVTKPVDGKADEVTEYVYDADGARLIGRTPTETTLYLGATELTLTKGAAEAKATRYIDMGAAQAVQSDDGSVSFVIGDQHGTGQLAIDAADLSINQRRTTPFGELRGNAPAQWPGTKGFVGGTTDVSTGLTHLGAREYDPSIGRFISLDPVLDVTNPQQMDGYAYADNSPVTGSDPTGLYCDGCSADNPDSVWAPGKGNGPGCTHYHCYDDDGKVISDIGGGSTGGSPTRPKTPTTSKPASPPGPIFLAGTRIPTPKEMDARMPGLWGDYQAQVFKWAEGQCLSDPKSEVCASAHALGWIEPGADLFGIQDMTDCAHGSVSGCLWTLAGFVPVGKIGKAAKLLKAGDEAGAARLGSCNSFTPETEVLLADGTRKKIADVDIGDEVLATDPLTGETTAKRVTAEIIGKGQKDLVEIALHRTDAKRGAATGPTPLPAITATADHPFWVPELREWVDATDLRPGQWLSTSADVNVQIADLNRWTEPATVHNLTVADLHTYYVVAGQTPVLVHNSGPCPTGLKTASAGLKSIFDSGSVRGSSIVGIRSKLLGDNFTQSLANNKKGYLFRNESGEEVRVMRRNGGWDIRVRNGHGNYLDEFGNATTPKNSHGIEVYSR